MSYINASCLARIVCLGSTSINKLSLFQALLQLPYHLPPSPTPHFASRCNPHPTCCYGTKATGEAGEAGAEEGGVGAGREREGGMGREEEEGGSSG